MKKIALLLAMLLCLAPVLSACGAHSSAKKAATAAFEAYYVDQDSEAYYEVSARHNLELIDAYINSSTTAEELKSSVRSRKDSTKESIKKVWDSYTKSEADGGKDAEDFNVDSYEVLYENVYKSKTDAFDGIMENFPYGDTDLEDQVTKVAKVGVLMTITYTIGDDDYTEAGVQEYVCYLIDGDWYVR